MAQGEKVKRLIYRYEKYYLDEMSDLFQVYAAEVEEALISAGAEPEKDYTYMDVFKLAQPLFMNHVKLNANVKFTAGTNIPECCSMNHEPLPKDYD